MHCALNKPWRRPYWLLFVATFSAIPRAPGSEPVAVISEEVREKYDLHDFYKKVTFAGGIPIIGSGKVADASLLEARHLIKRMLTTAPLVRRALAESGVQVAVMATDEFTTDIPEHSHLQPRSHWNQRARGLGGTPEIPTTSCAEENLLGCPGDPYAGENILIHEFSHTVHLVGMVKIDPGFDDRLRAAYEAAKSAGLWENTYAMTNREEYFAEGTQSWFDCNAAPGKVHGKVRTRETLKRYDPALAELLEEVYGPNPWRYASPQSGKSRQFGEEVQWPVDKRFAWPHPKNLPARLQQSEE